MHCGKKTVEGAVQCLHKRHDCVVVCPPHPTPTPRSLKDICDEVRA
uniref:Uncharacterized protein n=1 Tax=Anguilla anguilla TaxID=7936 RepID=A0A0E9WKF2_ANGAN